MTNLVELLARYRTAGMLKEAQEEAVKLVCQVGPNLHLYLRQRISPDCLEDVYQETLIGLIKGLDRFKGRSDGEFWRYCYRIASNKCVDQRRREARDPLEFVDPQVLRRAVEASAPDAAIASEEWEAVEHALKLLRAAESPCADYLWSRYILDMDSMTIAETYGLNYDSVHVTLSRCLQKLRSLLAKRL